MLKQLAKILRRLLGGGYLIMIVGAVGLVVDVLLTYILSPVVLPSNPTDWQTISKMIVDKLIEFQSDGLWIFGGAVLFGCLISYSRSTIDELWKDLQPSLRLHFTNVENEFKSTIRIQHAKECLARMTADEAKEFAPSVISHAYGAHCDQDGSLVDQVRTKLFPYFDSRKPYRDNYNRTTTVTDLGDGTLSWDEDISYDIRCRALDNVTGGQAAKIASQCFPYELIYSSLSKIKGTLPSRGKLSCSEIRVTIGPSCLFDSNIHLKNKRGVFLPKIDGVTVKYYGSDLELNFVHQVAITKSPMHVNIKSKHITDINDSTLNLLSKNPSHGARISITVPSKWRFEDPTYGDKSIWTGGKSTPIAFVAETTVWTLPGLMMSIRLVRP